MGLALVVALAMLQVVVENRVNEPEGQETDRRSRAWLRAASCLGTVALLLLAARAAGLVPHDLEAASAVGIALCSTGACTTVSARYVWWRRQLRPIPDALRGLLEKQHAEASTQETYSYWIGSAPPLPEVYVEQRTEYLLPARSAIPDEGRSGPLTLAQMLERSMYSLVVADPGVGKSTAVARVLREQTAWWLRARRSSAPEDAPYGPSIPIALPPGLHGCESLAEAMAKECELRTGTNPGLGLFAGDPPGGRSWLVLIDGLDHVLVARRRHEALRRLGVWIAQSPGRHRFVITTRPLLVGEIGRLGADLVGRYELQRFDEEGLREFAARWVAYRHAHEVPGVDRPITVERFMASIASASLFPLARVPLIATITALILEWSQETALPTGRADLYELYIEHLFASRTRDLEQAPPGPEFETAGAAGRQAWEWLRANLREILEGTADGHLSPDVPGVAECAMRWIESHAPDGLFAAVPGWKGALSRVLTITSLIGPGPDGLRFIHPSFAEYLAAGPRARNFDLESWLADAQSPDSRSLALFILARLPRGTSDGTRTADTLVDLLLDRGGADVCVAGAILADGIEVKTALRDRVLDTLFVRLVREDQTTTEALQVLIDLSTDRAVLERLTAFAEEPANPSWVRADTAEQLCGVARETGTRLLRHVLETTTDPGLHHRLLLLLDGLGAATDEERRRTVRYRFDEDGVDVLSIRAGQWYRQVAENAAAAPRVRLHALVAIVLRRETGWEDLLADVIVHEALTQSERLDAARTLTRLAEPGIMQALRLIALSATEPREVTVPLLAALTESQDEAARAQLNRLSSLDGAEFRRRFPFVPALRDATGIRSSERPPALTASERRPKAWGSVPMRNMHFTGREELLEKLRAALTSTNVASVLPPQELQGLGGIGKTQLAIEYAHRHHADYELVWWIPADQPARVRSSLASLAPHLGLPGAATVGVEEASSSVLTALRRGDPYSRWLLIFDNADEPEGLEELLPEGPGHVLITTRNVRWQRAGVTVALDVMPRRDSVEFLGKRFGENISPEEADRLAAELGDLPLALEQAAALMTHTRMHADDFLHRLREQASELESRAPGYPASVTASWKLSVADLADRSPGAVDLLRLLAFFGPDPVPHDLLTYPHVMSPDLASLIGDPIALSRAIAELGRYALARIDTANRTIGVHRLIQALLREELAEDEQRRIRRDAQLLVASYLDVPPEDPSAWGRFRVVFPHIESLRLSESREPEIRDLALNVARYLHAVGDDRSARTMIEELITAWRTASGEDDLDVLAARHLLGTVLRGLGAFASAAALDENTLGNLESTVGPAHDLTLATMVVIAANLRASGDFGAARACDEESLPRFADVHGEDSPRTLQVLHNLALDLTLTGDYAAARTLYARVVQSLAPHMPTAQSLVLRCREGLARCLRLCGEYTEAFDLAEEAYANAIETFGADHPMTLGIANELAVVLRRAGDHEGSRRLATEVYGDLRRLSGPDHPGTLAAAVTLANCLRTMDDVQAAFDLATDTTDRYLAVYGAAHPFTHGCASNLATLHRLRGDIEEARRRDETAFDRLEAGLGPDHPITLAVAVNLATDLALSGNFGAAVDLERAALHRLGNTLGRDHPQTLACMTNLSIDLAAAGEEESDTLFEEADEAYSRTIGLEHSEAKALRARSRIIVDFDPPPI